MYDWGTGGICERFLEIEGGVASLVGFDAD